MRKLSKSHLVLLLIILSLLICLLPSNIIFSDNSSTEIIVVAKEHSDIEEITKLVSTFGDDIVLGRSIDNYLLVNVKNNSRYDTIINALNNSEHVLLTQPNHTYYMDTTTISYPNDEYFNLQWGLNNDSNGHSYRGGFMHATADVDIDVLEAWNYYSGKKEVIVAIIDTGIDYKHPDLANIMWTNKNEIPDNGIDDDNNGYIDDYHGWNFYNDNNTMCYYYSNPNTGQYTSDPRNDDDHGTHCAGIIAAITNNNIGIAGVASNIPIKIMSVKALGGSEGIGSTFSIIEAIKYAELMGAKICNTSWNSYIYDEVLKITITESSMLFVTAAGNIASNNDEFHIYPGSFGLNNVITVASVDARGYLSYFSSYGSNSVDIAAPGERIYSTYVNSYGFMDGTSMAAPFVTAVAAMLYSSNSGLYAANIKEVLLKSIKPLPNLDGKIANPGIISAYKSIQNIDKLIQDTTPPTISLRTDLTDSGMSITASINDIGDSGLRVTKWLKGTYNSSDFNKGYNGNSLQGFDLPADINSGDYTFYASDYAGNEITKIITVGDTPTSPPIINAKSITLYKIKKTLHKGDTFTLKYILSPKDTTDKVTFTTSNKKVANVSKKGKITARRKGTANIKAVTSSGKKAVIKIVVK